MMDEYVLKEVVRRIIDSPRTKEQMLYMLERTPSILCSNEGGTVSRQVAIRAVDKYYNDHKYGTRSRTILSEICKDMKNMIEDLPSEEPEGWMQRNKERILQAGMKGRELEFRIGGRLFAIREKAQ